jgi:hypothetical protein
MPNSASGMRKSAWTGIPHSTLYIPNPTGERSWLLWVAILSIPSWVFVLLYAVHVPSVMSREAIILDLGLVQALTWLGLFGACMTFGAFILAMAANIRGSISAKTRRTMWVLVTLSLAGWVYIWVSLSMIVPLPPLLPF